MNGMFFDDMGRDTIIAALRYWQTRNRVVTPGERDEINKIATGHDTHGAMSNEDIDRMITRILVETHRRKG